MKRRKPQAQVRTENEIERVLSLLNRAAKRLEPYGQLQFEMRWIPKESSPPGKTDGPAEKSK